MNGVKYYYVQPACPVCGNENLISLGNEGFRCSCGNTNFSKEESKAFWKNTGSKDYYFIKQDDPEIEEAKKKSSRKP